jgi:hypothetical protein
VLLENDKSLKKEWNEKGLYWFNNIFDYNNHNELKDQILSPFKNFWSDLRWHSWSNSYSNESAKSYLWTPSIDDNYKLYQSKRKVKSSITKDMNISYKFCSWLERLCGSVAKLIVEKSDINCNDLLLIGLNINACGKSGLAFHKDTCKNNGYGEVIVNLVLSGGGFVVLSESKTRNASKYGIWLGAGDCYVISDSSRFKYFHKVTTAVAKAKNVARERDGVLSVEFKPEEMRMSLTLRFFYNRDRNPNELFDCDLSQ